MMYGPEKSDPSVVCAGQRVVQEGSSPSDAWMRSVISERGGNASRAGESKEGMEKPKRARKRKPDTRQGGPEATSLRVCGGLFALARGCPS